VVVYAQLEFQLFPNCNFTLNPVEIPACSSSFESFESNPFPFFQHCLHDKLIISGFKLSVSRFVLSLLVSVLLAAYENLKLINFDLELCIRKFETNQFQFFQHYRDNEICSG
jgi:hypothetical protein